MWVPYGFSVAICLLWVSIFIVKRENRGTTSVHVYTKFLDLSKMGEISLYPLIH
jgi:hypothetical protein